VALRDILQRRAISVADRAQRKLTGSRLLQRTTLVTPMQHRRQGKFIKLMHRTFDSLPLAVAGIPDILLCIRAGLTP